MAFIKISMLFNKSFISKNSSAWWHISNLPGILQPKETTFLNALAYVAPGHVIGSSLDPVTSLNTSHKVVTKGSVFETNSADFSSSNFIEISGKSKIESEIYCFINAI